MIAPWPATPWRLKRAVMVAFNRPAPFIPAPLPSLPQSTTRLDFDVVPTSSSADDVAP